MLIEWFPTFTYFNTWHAFDPCQDILDFGSNRGNLIHSSMNKISPEQYTGIDVDLEALVEGKKLFPQANWIHYNRYNPVYNKQGDASLPSLPKKYHAIFSYSVFTHMSMEDTIILVDHLMNHNLKENGKFYLSWCNIDYPPCVKWFQTRRENCDDIASDDFCYLIDNKVAKSPRAHHANYFVAFYRQEFLAKIFSNYTIDFYPPPHGWVQHCMCLQN